MANTTIKSVILQGDGKAFIQENRVRKEASLTVLALLIWPSFLRSAVTIRRSATGLAGENE